MMKNVSESLAGRVGIINLRGFSLNELEKKPDYNPFLPTSEYITEQRKSAKKYGLKEIYEIIHRGSFPAMNVEKNQDWEMFYSTYLNTYLERDIRDLTKISDELTFLQFIRTVAARTGQMLNYADIASAVGISQPTAKSWLSLLVSSGLVYLLEPYHNNINKRIVKTPKIYFIDTGLCSYLTNWSTPEVLEAGAMSGAMFETFVVAEILKSYLHNGKRAPIYYYRDKEKKEIDLIIERDGKLYPIEIKKTAKPDKSGIKNFDVLSNYAQGAIICLCSEDLPLTKDVNVVPVGYL
jgi:predicted AAA+ superfamily ATPase